MGGSRVVPTNPLSISSICFSFLISTFRYRLVVIGITRHRRCPSPQLSSVTIIAAIVT